MRRLMGIAAAVMALAACSAEAQTCDQTLSVGANVASAVSGASAGSTICLNSGNYGAVSLSNINKSDFVTLAAAPGATATLALQSSDISFVRFKGLKVDYSHVIGNFHHVEYVDVTFKPGEDGLYFNTGSDTPPATPQAILLDGCVFIDVSTALWDGRLNFRGVRGAKVINSVFSGSNNAGAKSDGIMLIGGSRQVEIGPGNEFYNFNQAAAQQGEHIDSIQMYGSGPDNKIIGNYFHDSDVFAGAFDGVNALTIENNVFDGRSSESAFKITMQAASNITFRHNTSYDANFRIDNKAGDPVSSNVIVENNVFLGDGGIAQTGGCNNCTYRYNLFDAGDSTGTNNVIGTPTFVGGSSPSSYAGWALAMGSLGENAGNDGLDMGIVFDSEPPPPPPPPPDPEEVTRGETVLGFDHDGLNTIEYQVEVNGTRHGIVPTVSGGVYQFVLPEAVDLGVYEVRIWAVGPGGETSGEAVIFEIVESTPPPPPSPATPSAPRVVQ